MIALNDADLRLVVDCFCGRIFQYVVISSYDVYAAYEAAWFHRPYREPLPITEDAPKATIRYLYGAQAGYDKGLLEEAALRARAVAEILGHRWEVIEAPDSLMPPHSPTQGLPYCCDPYHIRPHLLLDTTRMRTQLGYHPTPTPCASGRRASTSGPTRPSGCTRLGSRRGGEDTAGSQVVLRRLLLAIPVLVGVSIVVFAIIRVIPGDPAQVMLGDEYTPQAAAELRRKWGLDRPLVVQYAIFMERLVLHGDLGTSIAGGSPVMAEVMSRLRKPSTLPARRWSSGSRWVS